MVDDGRGTVGGGRTVAPGQPIKPPPDGMRLPAARGRQLGGSIRRVGVCGVPESRSSLCRLVCGRRESARLSCAGFLRLIFVFVMIDLCRGKNLGFFARVLEFGL